MDSQVISYFTTMEEADCIVFGLSHDRKNDRTYMGYGLRTDDWRYVVWVSWNTKTYGPNWDEPFAAEELYDHRDPRCNEKGNFDLCENHNLADEESLKHVREDLLAKVRTLSDTYNLKAWQQWKMKADA